MSVVGELMAYLVSGSSGFIGANLCLKLALYDEVYAVYHETPPALTYPSNIHPVPFSRIGELAGLRGIDTVVHCAAVHPNSLPKPPSMEKYVHVNCLLTKKMAEVANSLSVRQFLYMSTISVYGDVKTSCLDEGTPFFIPGAYGTSKYMGELIMKEVSTAHKRISLRLPGVVGRSSCNAWLCGVKQRALNNLPIELYNPDALFNNLTDIDEIARFVNLLPGTSGPEYDVLNMGTSEPVTVLEAVKRLIELTGSKSTIELSGLSRDSFYISTEKLSNEYGFIPVKTIDCISRYSVE